MYVHMLWTASVLICSCISWTQCRDKSIFFNQHVGLRWKIPGNTTNAGTLQNLQKKQDRTNNIHTSTDHLGTYTTVWGKYTTTGEKYLFWGKYTTIRGKNNFSAQWQQRVVLHRSGLWNKDPGLVAKCDDGKLVLPHNVRYAKYSYRILWENCVRDSETKISKCFAEIWVSSWLK